MPRPVKVPSTVAAAALVPSRQEFLRGSARLEALVSKLDLTLDDIAVLEAQLAEGKAIAQDLAENIIPEAMANEGVETFTVSYKKEPITVKTSYHASITKVNKDEAFKWLEASQNTDVLKDQVIISFGLKEYAEATVCRRFLEKQFPNHPVEVKRTVPGSTLVAFAKRMLEAGANWPAELFGAFHKRTVVLPWRKPVKEEKADADQD